MFPPFAPSCLQSWTACFNQTWQTFYRVISLRRKKKKLSGFNFHLLNDDGREGFHFVQAFINLVIFPLADVHFQKMPFKSKIVWICLVTKNHNVLLCLGPLIPNLIKLQMTDRKSRNAVDAICLFLVRMMWVNFGLRWSLMCVWVISRVRYTLHRWRIPDTGQMQIKVLTVGMEWNT